MNFTFFKHISIITLLSLHCLSFYGNSLLSVDYEWHPLKVGAGGWVVGMYIHPTELNLRYIRTDVAGAYRWEQASQIWKQIVRSDNMPADYVKYSNYAGVHSIVGAPDSPDVAYMAFRGQIFISTNRGDHWLATTFGNHNVKMDSNGSGRQEGERLAVDPNNCNVVYYGSTDDGLWMTSNAGITWSKIENIPIGEAKHGVNTIVFDKNSGKAAHKTKTIYVTVDGGGVFKTSDAGITWKRISDSGPGSIRRYRDAEIGIDGTYYTVAANQVVDGGVWKYSEEKWTDITPDGQKQVYVDIAVDPANPQHIVVARDGKGMYSSSNQGKSWISHNKFKLVSPTIKWLDKQSTGWLSVGEILFDPVESGKLWFAEGFGVWWTKDLSTDEIIWTEESAGIEETCGNAVISPPGGKPITAMWDIGVFYHQNQDSYDAIRAYDYFLSGWFLDWCPADPDFIVGVFQTQHAYRNEPMSSFSIDGGKTWTPFPSQTKDHAYGCITVSADSKDNIVRLPSNNHLPYYTKDRGKNWFQCSIPGITETGYKTHWSPVKPICGDRVEPSTFYFYQQYEGVFKSTDGGANWKKVSKGPVLRRYNSMMKTTPGYANDIWFAEGKEENVVGGLWHSTNGGSSWISIDAIEQAFSFGFGKPEKDSNYPTLFVAGVLNGEYGIYRSINAGETWIKIGTYPLGIFDYIDDIDGDKDQFGKVYICFSGAGFAYGVEK